jgi:hypothetical protein
MATDEVAHAANAGLWVAQGLLVAVFGFSAAVKGAEMSLINDYTHQLLTDQRERDLARLAETNRQVRLWCERSEINRPVRLGC